MKAISLWPPWSTLMALGEKTIETRSWIPPARFTGPLIICATATWNKDVLAACTNGGQSDDFKRIICAIRGKYKSLSELPLGSALCVVYLIGCRRTEDIRDRINDNERAFGDYSDGRFAWMTDKSRLHRFEKPIPCRGSQGLWNFPEYLLPKKATKP